MGKVQKLQHNLGYHIGELLDVRRVFIRQQGEYIRLTFGTYEDSCVTQSQIQAVLPYLQYFAKHGVLPNEVLPNA